MKGTVDSLSAGATTNLRMECLADGLFWYLGMFLLILLEGSWYLLTNYKCTYNPTYNTPRGPCRGYPNCK